MITYEGDLGELGVKLVVPGTGLLSKGYLELSWADEDKKGTRRGVGTKVSRTEILEFVEMLRRML